MNNESNNQDKNSQQPLAADSKQPPPSTNRRKIKKPVISKTYEGNPNSHEAVQKTVKSIPLKDYSDYEITIETKASYEDALFSDVEALDEALEQARNQSHSSKLAPVEPLIQEKPEEVEYDFSEFLTADSQAGKFSASSTKPLNGSQLSVPKEGLNNSPVSIDITAVANSHESSADSDQTQELLIEEYLEVAEPQLKPSEFEPKTLVQKIAQKARKQLNKSKAEFDEYTGRSLPERELPLEFSFPPLKPKKDFDSIMTGYDIRKLFDNKGKSSHSVLKQAESDLAKVVKCHLSSSNRLSLLDAYSEPLFVVLKAVTAMFERKPSVPNDSKRLQLAEFSHASLKHLITGYKQVYAPLYEAANVLYGPQRNSANKVAFRLIDLLLLEQQLAMSIQTSLASGSVKTFNKLFTALSLYEPQLIARAQHSLSLDELSSIKAMYLRYQVGLAFNFMGVSSSLHKSLNPYIHQNLGWLKLLPLETIAKTTVAAWVTTHEHSEAPSFLNAGETITHTQVPSVVIEVERFFNAIKKDYAECIDLLGSVKKHSSIVLGTIKLPYSATLLCELNRLISTIENKTRTPNYSLYRPLQLKAYSGLENCIGYFDYDYALKTKKTARKGEPVKDLPPKPISTKTQWHCAMEDEANLHLQIIEEKAAIIIDIGQLILFTKPVEQDETEDQAPKDPAQQTLLTRVIRMERLQQGKLNIIAEIISNKISHITLRIYPKEEIPALLAINNDKRLLITDHKKHHWTNCCHRGTSISVSFPDLSKSVIAVDNLQAISQTMKILKLL
ncbi:MAG: hypothetical protein V3T17_09560 [Pseudomonadales bacterium]